jgi:DNA-binding MarR family transcriptional regulator
MKAATAKRPAPVAGELGLEAWKAFLFAHSRLVRELDEELQQAHGVAIGDFDVLVNLANAPGRRLRMCDLADRVLLSPSGISRRVERLEREGLVQRRRATGDARSIEAGLTSAGTRLLRRLRRIHREGIRNRFVDHFSAGELEALRDLLGRLTQST